MLCIQHCVVLDGEGDHGGLRLIYYTTCKADIDIRQYGGIKGNSVTHYLIELMNFTSLNKMIVNPPQ